MISAEVDITSGAFKKDSHRFYRELRESSPISSARLPDGQTLWLVSRYADVERLLKDERLFKDKRKLQQRRGLARLPQILRSLETLERNMLDVDPPDHGRLRRLVHKAFTPRRVEAMEGRIKQLSEELLHGASREDPIDLIRDYALPIPTTIIAEMLGIPAEDRPRFQRWSKVVVSAGSRGSLLRTLPSLLRFVSYLRRAIAGKRKHPADDVLSALVEAEESSDRLDADEVLAMALLLVVAGHETTVNLIANGVLALLQHPLELERLVASPSLLPTAVEELLRFESPVEIATERYAAEPMEIDGAVIPRHELVGLVLASANRDERRFERPDQLDVGRTPNPHLAFGDGLHFCLGAPLARLEGRIALETLLCRFPHLRLAVAPQTLRYRPGLNLRGLETLPVVLDG